MTVYVSPVSIKKLATLRNPLGWYNFVLSHPTQQRISTQLCIAGFCFRAASRPLHASTHGKLQTSADKMRYSLLWLIAQYAMDRCHQVKGALCRLIGRVIDRLREHFTPRDPILHPDEVFPYPGMKDFNEYGLQETVFRVLEVLLSRLTLGLAWTISLTLQCTYERGTHQKVDLSLGQVWYHVPCVRFGSRAVCAGPSVLASQQIV